VAGPDFHHERGVKPCEPLVGRIQLFVYPLVVGPLNNGAVAVVWFHVQFTEVIAAGEAFEHSMRGTLYHDSI